ncbi:MAG: alkaline phosphatase D family protein [Burkholderiales bacterium]
MTIFDRDSRYPGDSRRRRFLQAAAAAPLALAQIREAHAASLDFPPAAFDATPDSALIWVCADGAARVRVDFGVDPAALAPGPSAVLAQEANYSAALPLTRLEPGRTWAYRIVDAESGKPMSELGRFKTPPAAATPFTFAFSADMEDSYRPFSLFDAIDGKQPDFFLLLGDTVYADHPKKEFSPSVSYYRRKHAAIRKDPHLQRFLARHVTYATWDDHEIENNSHGGHPHMESALQVYREFWPCRNVDAAALYRQFAWAGTDFFMLDTRRFRSMQSLADDANKTMLGAAQKNWLKDRLKTSGSPFKFVMTSVPFHGGGDDTWGAYKTERDEITQFVRDEKIRGVIFLTGDYHLARDWSNPKTGLREYMAGPIGSFTHYQRTPKSRERYEKAGTFHYGDGYNFGLWRIDPAAGKASLEFIGVKGETLHRIELNA